MGCLISEGVCVAPRSTNGHYVKDAARVICLDEIEEIYEVQVSEGKCAKLVTANHGEQVIKEDCTIYHQDSINPFTGIIEKARD